MHIFSFSLYCSAAFILGDRAVPTESLKILNVVIGYSNSLKLYSYRMTENLAALGHNVTILLVNVSTGQNSYVTPPKNVPILESDGGAVINFDDAAYQTTPLFLSNLFMNRWFRNHSQHVCDNFFSNSALSEVLYSSKFDLILNPVYFTCSLQFWQDLKVPVIFYAAGMYVLDYIALTNGLPYPSSYVPHTSSENSDRMNFFQRLENSVTELEMNIPQFDRVLRQLSYFHDAYSFPPLNEVMQKVPAIFLNGEQFLEFPRPMSHNFYYLGSMAKYTYKSLTAEWKTVMENSNKGVILFSFGSIAKAANMPLKWKLAFLRAFEKLSDYTVIWRYEEDFPEAESVKNIKFANWVPQKDLLAHPHLKAFITHGGYNSFLETVQAGKPVIMIPLFADQFGNAKRAVRLGLGLLLEKPDINEHSVFGALQTILQNDRYSQRALKLKAMVCDDIRPSEEAMNHFMERIIRNRNYPVLSGSVSKLNLLQYYSLDTAGTLLLATAFISGLLYNGLRTAYRPLVK